MIKHILIILLFVSCIVNAQVTKQAATLYFKNGEILNCFARVSGDYIRYATKPNTSKETKVNFKEVDHINLRNDDLLIKLFYKLEQGKTKPRLMEKIIDGNVNLYKISNVHSNTFGILGNMTRNPHFGTKKTLNTQYFLDTKNDTTVFRIQRNFNDTAKQYFEDCKELVQLIGNDGFRKKDLLNIVLYYNTYCK